MTKLYSTFQERYNHTPKTRGYWTGERGNSIFIPLDTYSDVINELNTYRLDELELEGIHNILEIIVNEEEITLEEVKKIKNYIIK